MKWTIKHKSGRVLFVTSDEFIAENRRKMGWIVDGVECDHEWVSKGSYPDIYYECLRCGEFGYDINEGSENDE